MWLGRGAGALSSIVELYMSSSSGDSEAAARQLPQLNLACSEVGGSDVLWYLAAWLNGLCSN